MNTAPIVSKVRSFNAYPVSRLDRQRAKATA